MCKGGKDETSNKSHNSFGLFFIYDRNHRLIIGIKNYLWTPNMCSYYYQKQL
jgi:hypothetical protein